MALTRLIKRITTVSSTKPSLVTELLVLSGLFLFSLLIRSINLTYGFPLLLHPDEGVILDQAFFMTREGYLFPGNPGNFIRPNQILYNLNYFILNMMSYLRFGENFAARYQLFELHFYHYARLLIAILGALIPVIAYRIGKLFKPSFALAAGLVFMVFPSFVLHSHYITPDVPITLFTLLVLYFTLRYLIKKENHSLYLAVFFAALNTAEKYPGVLSLAIIFMGIVLNAFEKSDVNIREKIWPIIKQFLFIIFVFFLALFLVAPKLFLHCDMVRVGFIHSSRSTHIGADHLGFWGRLIFYIQSFASWTNLLGLLFIIAGCWALLKWRNKVTVLFFFGIFYWVSLSVLALHWERWALPMYITPLFLIAIGVSFLWNKYKDLPIIKWALGAIIFMFFVQQGVAALYTSVSLGYTDTRLIALEYAQENEITPEKSLFEGYTPFQIRQAPKTIFSEYVDNSNNYDYIILSSAMSDRYFINPNIYAEEVSLYQNIRENHTLLVRFEPDKPATTIVSQLEELVHYFRQRLHLSAKQFTQGPIIEIYRVN